MTLEIAYLLILIVVALVLFATEILSPAQALACFGSQTTSRFEIGSQ